MPQFLKRQPHLPELLEFLPGIVIAAIYLLILSPLIACQVRIDTVTVPCRIIVLLLISLAVVLFRSQLRLRIVRWLLCHGWSPPASHDVKPVTTDSRLNLLDPALADVLTRASPADLRRIARTAAHFVVESNSLQDPVVARALALLDRDESAGEQLRKELWSTVESLDELQWDLHDALDEGRATEDEYIKAFSRARAANAVYCTLAPDQFQAAAESIYEAQAATDQIEHLRSIVMHATNPSP